MFWQRERPDPNAGLWRGVAIGLAVGAGLALLLTPYSGKRFRAKLLHGAERLRREVRGTEAYGGGEGADPLHLLKRRVDEALAEARLAYEVKRAELRAELERDRAAAIGPAV